MQANDSNIVLLTTRCLAGLRLEMFPWFFLMVQRFQKLRVHFTQSRGLVWASGKKHLVGAGILEEDDREGMMFLKVFIRLMDGNCDWQK